MKGNCVILSMEGSNPAMNKELFRIENLVKRYNVTVLNQLNLTVLENDYISIIGKSGSGKSTLIHILGLMDSYDEGSIFFHGQPLNPNSDHASIRAQSIGFIFQSYNLIPHLSAEKNIVLPAVFSNLDYDHKRMKALYEHLNIEHLLDTDVSVLSGGEKQRVAICRALLFDPPLILADEPTGNLDAENEELIFQLFKKLHQEKKTIIVITHNQERAKEAVKQYVLEGGKLHAKTTL